MTDHMRPIVKSLDASWNGSKIIFCVFLCHVIVPSFFIFINQFFSNYVLFSFVPVCCHEFFLFISIHCQFGSVAFSETRIINEADCVNVLFGQLLLFNHIFREWSLRRAVEILQLEHRNHWMTSFLWLIGHYWSYRSFFYFEILRFNISLG